MAKYTVCVGMSQTPGGVAEINKEVTASALRIEPDGSLVFCNVGNEIVAVFKQYLYCLEEGQIPVIKPVRAITQ